MTEPHFVSSAEAHGQHTKLAAAEEGSHLARFQFISAGGVRWHVQVAGQGPTLLLLHGTGASLHSFSSLVALLSPHFKVIAPDLPGHHLSLPISERFSPTPSEMAAALGALLRALDAEPEVVVGHSLGAALAVRMALDAVIKPNLLVGIAAALTPFPALLAPLMQGSAQALSRVRLVKYAVALHAHRAGVIEAFLRGTGRAPSAESVAHYTRLARNPEHVAGVLRLLAHWNIDTVFAGLGDLAPPLLLLAGADDAFIPLEQQHRVASLCKTARVEVLAGAGHLVHEDQPALVARAICLENSDRLSIRA